MDVKIPTESYVGDTSAFVAFLESKVVDFNGEMRRFEIVDVIKRINKRTLEQSLIINGDEAIEFF